MDPNQEELRKRGENTVEEEDTTKEVTNVEPEEKPPQPTATQIVEPYNVEKDPRYKWLFIFLKLVIVVLSLISFAIIFLNWIAPYLIPTSKKLEVLKEHLINNFCPDGECTEEDWESINRILERAQGKVE